MTIPRQHIRNQISAARKADFDKRVAILQKLNSSLPEEMRLDMPSMFTHAYVRRALETIEDRVCEPVTARK